MRFNKKSPVLTSAAALTFAVTLATVAVAQPAHMLPLQDGDLAATELHAPLGLKASSVPTEAVSMSWAIPADKAIDLGSNGQVATSKEYWVDVTAKDLQQGVPVLAQSPGALVRINPAPGDKALAGVPLNPRNLTVLDANKRAFSNGSAMEVMASPEQLKAAGSPFVEGTMAFRLRSDLGAGPFTVKSDGLGEGHYVMHVLDAGSPVELALKTPQAEFLHGQQLTVEANFQIDGKVALSGLAMEGADGFVVSPAGRSWPVRFTATDSGAYKASLALDALEAPAPGLWEAHVAVQGKADGLDLRRYAKVAFQVTVPSARFTGGAEKVALVHGGLGLRLGVTTASASRYEVRGVLFGTDAEGTLRPIAVGHSANWLETGDHALVLSFDQELLDASGLSAPFEVQDLRLVDQGTMGTLHRQARGLLIQ